MKKALSVWPAAIWMRARYDVHGGNAILRCKFRAREIIGKVDKLWFNDKITPTQAEVAELADALGSGLSGLTLVRVQVPPSAHFFQTGILVFSGCP